MNLHIEYVIFIFFSALGVIQISAGYGKLRGLLITKSINKSIAFGISVLLISMISFFRDGGRNIPDTEGGVPGFSQFLLFAIGSSAALFFTFASTSLTNLSSSIIHTNNYSGLMGLRHYTYLQIISTSSGVANWILKQLTRKYSSG